jgi:hypothetical protein
MRLIDADKLDLYTALRPYCSFDAACTITDIIDNEPTVNPYEWISVEDRLPETNEDVLIYRGKRIGCLVNVYTYLGNNEWEDEYGYWSRTDDESITHWMPLPTPPTEKER